MNVIDTKSIDTATKFIAPMVFKDNIRYSNTLQNFYKTCLSIIDKPEYDDNIIIVSTTPLIDKNLKYKKTTIVANERYRSNFEYLNIFHIPEEYEDDLYLIVAGKYSRLSDKYKRRLLYFWNEDKDSKLFAVLFKDKTKLFSHSQYYKNKYTIDNADEYYEKPAIYELVYDLSVQT